MAQINKIKVEIVYAAAEKTYLTSLEVSLPCTVNEAIQQSNILNQFPEIDLSRNKTGIFSTFVNLDTLVQAGDRIEIYQPLLIDPKQARKLRAKK